MNQVGQGLNPMLLVSLNLWPPEAGIRQQDGSYPSCCSSVLLQWRLSPTLDPQSQSISRPSAWGLAFPKTCLAPCFQCWCPGPQLPKVGNAGGKKVVEPQSASSSGCLVVQSVSTWALAQLPSLPPPPTFKSGCPICESCCTLCHVTVNPSRSDKFTTPNALLSNVYPNIVF